MLEATGDLWTYEPADCRVITVNGITNSRHEAVMGAGCAREAKELYPTLPRYLGLLLRTYGNRPFRLGRFQGADLATFPTKDHWREPSDPNLIWQGAQKLTKMATKFGWQHVVMPRPGCGLGQLSWEDQVKPLLRRLLDDRFTVIHRGS